MNKRYNAEQLYKSAKAELITLPAKVKVDNCTNCKYVHKNECLHPKMKMPLIDGAENMCCDYWDHDGVKHWGKSGAKGNPGPSRAY